MDGQTVCLSSNGNRVVIGSTLDRILVYDYAGVGNWRLVQQFQGGYENSSASLSFNGNRIAIGSPSNGAGNVRVYDFQIVPTPTPNP